MGVGVEVRANDDAGGGHVEKYSALKGEMTPFWRCFVAFGCAIVGA